MADEEQTIVDGAPGQEASGAGGGKSKIMLLAIVGVGAAVLGIVVALFVLKPMMADAPEGDATHEVAEDGDGHGDSHGDKGKHATSGSGSVLYAIEDIIVNPAGTGGTRFLSVSFGLELASRDLANMMEDREPIVRDALITILASKTVAQLTDAKQKEITRYQIKKRLENLLETEDLKGVYYTDFVLQ